MEKKLSYNREKILDSARTLLQIRGFNAFSHRDLAALVAIKSSSVHYYFPTKEDLGIALIQEYIRDMEAFFAEREMSDPVSNLKNFFALFEETADEGDKLCLAAMLASDFQTFGEPLQAALRAFFTVVENWLAEQILKIHPAQSKDKGLKIAQGVFATLEGALLISRVFEQPARVRQAARLIVCLLQEGGN